MLSRRGIKLISRSTAMVDLDNIRAEFRRSILEFEQNAAPCSTCSNPGACCLDEHFVNVRVSRLEAESMKMAISELPSDLQHSVRARTAAAISKYKLDESLDTSVATYACPLFEKGIGCLVHKTAKPLPCIAHACYTNEKDLPPEELLEAAELNVDELNRGVFGKSFPVLPIPLAISR